MATHTQIHPNPSPPPPPAQHCHYFNGSWNSYRYQGKCSTWPEFKSFQIKNHMHAFKGEEELFHYFTFLFIVARWFLFYLYILSQKNHLRVEWDLSAETPGGGWGADDLTLVSDCPGQALALPLAGILFTFPASTGLSIKWDGSNCPCRIKWVHIWKCCILIKNNLLFRH